MESHAIRRAQKSTNAVPNVWEKCMILTHKCLLVDIFLAHSHFASLRALILSPRPNSYTWELIDLGAERLDTV